MKPGNVVTLILKSVLFTKKRNGILNTVRTAVKKLKLTNNNGATNNEKEIRI